MANSANLRTDLRTYVRLLKPARDLDWWIKWPPDVFALTSMIFKHTGIYVTAVLPPAGEIWPPANWKDQLKETKKAWLSYLVGEPSALHLEIQNKIDVIKDNWRSVMIEDLIDLLDPTKSKSASDEENARRKTAWEVCKALLELHGLADETCAGFGTLAGHYWRMQAEDVIEEDEQTKAKLAKLHFTANSLLAHTGSCPEFQDTF